MNKPEFFDEAKTMTGEYKFVTPGGYVCKIVQATFQKSKKSNNDMLVLLLDIAEGDLAGIYREKYDNDSRDVKDKKWGCVLRLVIDDPTKDKETRMKMVGRYKGALANIELSNVDFKVDWNKSEEEFCKDLKNKLIGIVFGLEEYTGADGSTKTISKPRNIKSVDYIKTKQVEIPSVRLLDNTYMSYDDYMEKEEEKDEAGDYITIESSEDLPF